eukprot:135475_1
MFFNLNSKTFSIMDHASELEVVPLSSGIDDIDQPHKSHPFNTPPFRQKNKIVDFQNAIRDKLAHKNASISSKTISITSKDIDTISNTSQTSFNEFIHIIAPSIGFFGCQFAWACQGGHVDPYLRQLGLADDMMNYAWILGPISGLIF